MPATFHGAGPPIIDPWDPVPASLPLTTADLPPGTTTGDLVVVAVTTRRWGGTVAPSIPGFTSLGSADAALTHLNALTLLAAPYAPGLFPTVITANWSGVDPTPVGHFAARAVVFRGAGTPTWEASHVGTNANTNLPSSTTGWAGDTIAVDDILAAFAWHTVTVITGLPTPNGFTQQHHGPAATADPPRPQFVTAEQTWDPLNPWKTSHTVTAPVGVQNGDIVVMFACRAISGASYANDGAWTASTGFTNIIQGSYAPSTARLRMTAFVAEMAPGLFPATVSTTSSSGVAAFIVTAVYRPHAAAPWLGATTANQATAAVAATTASPWQLTTLARSINIGGAFLRANADWPGTLATPNGATIAATFPAVHTNLGGFALVHTDNSLTTPLTPPTLDKPGTAASLGVGIQITRPDVHRGGDFAVADYAPAAIATDYPGPVWSKTSAQPGVVAMLNVPAAAVTGRRGFFVGIPFTPH